MPKIKDIQDRLHKDAGQYNLLSFLVARRIFLGATALYFTLFLFTIGGFYFWFFTINVLKTLTFHMLSVLIVVFVWFTFAFAEYFVDAYFPGKKIIAYSALGVSSVFGCIALYVHIFSSVV